MKKKLPIVHYLWKTNESRLLSKCKSLYKTWGHSRSSSVGI